MAWKQTRKATKACDKTVKAMASDVLTEYWFDGQRREPALSGLLGESGSRETELPKLIRVTLLSAVGLSAGGSNGNCK